MLTLTADTLPEVLGAASLLVSSVCVAFLTMLTPLFAVASGVL